MGDFHELRFPLDIALKSAGGPERRTQIVTTGSGRELRNTRWRNSRRRFEAGYGVKTLTALAQVTAFFEERRGKLYGFRFRDRADFKSCMPDKNPAATDQVIGSGTGTQTSFQLSKTYGSGIDPYQRIIRKPVEGSVLVAIDSGLKRVGEHYDIDHTTGIVNFRSTSIPRAGSVITAGYLFDVPVRFDTDFLDISFAAFDAGDIPSIPIVEIIV